MSTRSRPAARNGTGVRTYSTRRNEEEDRAERAEQLKKSKAGLIGMLRKTREEIANLRIERGDIWSDVIKRNMYVDDLMKSTETTADAILLVHKLKEQLSKGGFHLTKWCSNDRRVLAVVPEPKSQVCHQLGVESASNTERPWAKVGH